MNVDVDVRQYAPAAAGNTSLDEDVNRVQAQYEASKVNVITCLPNGEERSVSFLKEEDLVVAMARELGVRSTRICVSFTDNVVGMGLTAEDCGIIHNSRLTVTFIVDEMKTESEIMEVSIAIVQHNPRIGLTADAIFAKATFKNGKLENW